jgi:hypothetical protein
VQRENCGEGQKHRPDGDRYPPRGQRQPQDWRIDRAQRTHDECLGFLDVFGQEQRGQHRRDREGRDQGAGESEAIGACHRIENLPFHTLHGEKRNKGRHGHRRREQHGLVHLQGADVNQSQPIGPRLAGLSGRIGAVASFHQRAQQLALVLLRPLKITEYVFHQDHGGIDNDAEIDGADGQQISILSDQDQDDDAEEQRKGDIDPNDDGAAKVAKKHPLNQEDEQAAENEIVQDRVCGHVHKRGAVIEGDELHPWRQRSVGVDSRHRGLDARHNVVGMQCSVHHHDGRYDVILRIATGPPKPRHVPHPDSGNILYLRRHPIRLGKHNSFDIAHLPALGRSALPPLSIRPTPRMLTDCWPKRISRPPH